MICNLLTAPYALLMSPFLKYCYFLFSVASLSACSLVMYPFNLGSTLKNSPSFNPVGTGISSNIQTLAIDSSGKIVVAGEFLQYDTTSEPYVARLNADGSLDSSFTQSGTGLNGAVYAAAVDASGKIVLGGNFTQYNGTAIGRIIRLNADGTLDLSFNSSGAGFDALPHSLIISSSGKIYVGGEFTQYNGTSVAHLVQLNADGSLNAGFSAAGSGADNTVYKMAFDSSGHVVATGLFISYNGTAASKIARVNTDGTLDTTFVTGSGFDNYTTCVTVDSNGYVIVAGDFTNYNGTSISRLARLQSNGSIDLSFVTGAGLDHPANQVAVDSSNRILVTGSISSYNGSPIPFFIRVLNNGSLDTAFVSASTPGPNLLGFNLVLESSGLIYLAGGFSFYNFIPERFIAKLQPDGNLATQ